MLTEAENELLTRVGPGTPMGELMRRYWQPIAAAVQLDEEPVRKIRLLGEDLTLYRALDGSLGLVGDKCPHRRVDLQFGMPIENGLRCPYHGWAFDGAGKCVEMPYEEAEGNHTFKDKVSIKGYPVQEQRGMIFAYLGPLPAPLLPNWDFLTWDDVYYDIGSCLIPCNYLQIMENSLDPVHVEWLHVHFSNYVLERLGRNVRRRDFNTATGEPERHKTIKFDTFDYGILKKRIMEDTDENHPFWPMGHPIVFPNILKTTGFQYRVPVDDENTYHWWLFPYKLPEGIDMPLPQDKIPYYDVPMPSVLPNGRPTWDLLDNNGGQDIMMWITQGGIADRTQERLGMSDKGVIQYRQMLLDNLKRIERGEEPMNVFRDPDKNKYHELPSEYWYMMSQQGGNQLSRTGGASKYSPVLAEAVRKLRGEEALNQPVY